MGVLRMLRRCGMPRWSAVLVPFLFYAIFIIVVLNLSFPLKKATEDTTPDYVSVPPKAPETVILASADTDGTNLLRAAFRKADLDADGFLAIQELARYINTRVREHIQAAVRANPFAFAEIDVSPRDGLVTWEEYHAHFLKDHGLDEDYIGAHSEQKHVGLDRKTKETIMRDKALWLEAARTDPFSLTLDEFLAFRHPESSAANLLSLVDDLLRQFDLDGDDVLTLEEFSSNPDDDDDAKLANSASHRKSVAEKREEFRRLIDKNSDGRADRAELLSYIDPRHPRHSLQESATLFSLADANRDGKLSLDEVLSQAGVFLASKMINTSENFHEDF
ncbi:45 kDa calcium-binding protein [Phlebotomus argentipes]|uniref:45 kDa calcium-binding protein n=1 Tax=Phlebotomus argentipes TaxID=94469 RepID=UPI0028936757|nr:45 kDa calcium-binding protein [Phlebotomus argentipes]XP_059620992.1 45 kDa calcium-binding protein [Phlebotomus argentipes]